jgi:hypothetical protein
MGITTVHSPPLLFSPLSLPLLLFSLLSFEKLTTTDADYLDLLMYSHIYFMTPVQFLTKLFVLFEKLNMDIVSNPISNSIGTLQRCKIAYYQKKELKESLFLFSCAAFFFFFSRALKFLKNYFTLFAGTLQKDQEFVQKILELSNKFDETRRLIPSIENLLVRPEAPPEAEPEFDGIFSTNIIDNFSSEEVAIQMAIIDFELFGKVLSFFFFSLSLSPILFLTFFSFLFFSS